MNTYVVHLIITNNEKLDNGGARPIHEVLMQVDADTEYTATRSCIEWHYKTFGEMTVEHVGTWLGTLARS